MDASVHGKTLRNVVVFGAGYVGGLVARQARQVGHRVTALTRNPTTAAALRSAGIEVVEAKLGERSWHTAIDPQGAWVLNAVSSAGGGADGYRQSYLQGMQSILAWAEGSGVESLVYTSSTSVYPQDGGSLVDENSPAEPTSEQGQILRQAEELLLLAPNTTVRHRCVLRLAGIYGPERHHVLDQLREGAAQVGGVGSHHLNLVHRDDIAQAVWLAWQKEAEGIFNLADDHPTPKAEFVSWLAQRLGRPVPTFTNQPTLGRRATVPDRIILNRRAKDVLGWTPRFADFRAGYAAILGA